MIATTKPILVLGGTGKTGRRIADRLARLGATVRIGSRGASPAFDWHDPGTWPAALEGVERCYVSYHPDLASPGAAERIEAFVGAAAAAGVRRLVLLSGRGESEAQRCEAIVRAAPVESTVVRASWFNQNFSENFLVDPVRAGVVALPVGNVREPFVDADDIADVAVAALTEDGHAGRVYEVTGPRAITFDEAVAAIGDARGEPVRLERISMRAFKDGLREQAVPVEFIELLEYLFDEVLDGRNAATADGVRRALGRAPREFADYARQAARQGAWSTPSAA